MIEKFIICSKSASLCHNSLEIEIICAAGPVSGLLADKVGVRPTVIAGCIGTSTSLILASLTSNFTVLLFTYGILAGICKILGSHRNMKEFLISCETRFCINKQRIFSSISII